MGICWVLLWGPPLDEFDPWHDVVGGHRIWGTVKLMIEGSSKVAETFMLTFAIRTPSVPRQVPIASTARKKKELRLLPRKCQ